MGLFKRQTSGSVVCPSCGKLVGVSEPACWHCGRRNPGMWGYATLLRSLGGDLGLAEVVTWGCGFLYILSLALDPSNIGMNGAFGFLAPSHSSLLRLGSSGAVPVLGAGHWWTLLSAGWLHGGVLHILFNMLWVRQLAPAASAVYGSGRATILYVVSSATGFLLSVAGWIVASSGIPFLGAIMGQAYFTVGASAAIFGLLGGLVYAGRRGVAVHLGRQAWSYALILFIFGLVFPGVDNWAHLGGFLGGYGLARVFNPLTPERPDHLIGALAALAVSALAVIASFVQSGGL